jgi:hypothetical protein
LLIISPGSWLSLQKKGRYCNRAFNARAVFANVRHITILRAECIQGAVYTGSSERESDCTSGSADELNRILIDAGVFFERAVEMQRALKDGNVRVQLGLQDKQEWELKDELKL